jgi:hypothetical protein
MSDAVCSGSIFNSDEVNFRSGIYSGAMCSGTPTDGGCGWVGKVFLAGWSAWQLFHKHIHLEFKWPPRSWEVQEGIVAPVRSGLQGRGVGDWGVYDWGRSGV